MSPTLTRRGYLEQLAEEGTSVEDAELFVVQLDARAVRVADVEAVLDAAVRAEVVRAAASNFAFAAANCSAVTEIAMCWTLPIVSWNGG